MIVKLYSIIFLSVILTGQQVEPIEGAILRGLVPSRITFPSFINNRNDVSNNLETRLNGF